MTTHVNDSGTWRSISSIHVNDSGTWRTITNIYVNDSGTWREVYSAAAVVNPIPIDVVNDFRLAPNPASSSVQLSNDGGLAFTGNFSSGGTKWYDPLTTNIGASYWARLVHNSGDNSNTGTASGSLVSLATTRSWGMSASSGTSRNGSFTLNIYSDSGGTNLVSSATFVMQASSEF